MELSIIIINWNSVTYLAGCLESIYALPPRVSFEIVVVDNASHDGCAAMLATQFPAVRFVQSDVNLGFARANNLAFARSTGSTICFLNPDTVIKNNALQTLYDTLYTTYNAGITGAVLRNADQSLQTSCVLPFPTILNQVFDAEWLRSLFPRAGFFGAGALSSTIVRPQAVEAVSGACIMTPRDLFLKAGMFSTDYFMYAEDIDLCHKISLRSKKVYLINAAEIIHYGGGSSRLQKNRLFGALMIRESNYLLLKKFKGKRYAQLYRYSLALASIGRLLILSACLPLATIFGHRTRIIEIIQRWWHLFCWAVQIPHNAPPAALSGNA